MNSAKSIKFLDVFYLKTSSEQYETLKKLATDKDIDLHVREPYTNVCNENENVIGGSDVDCICDNQDDNSGSDSDQDAPGWDMFGSFDNDDNDDDDDDDFP